MLKEKWVTLVIENLPVLLLWYEDEEWALLQEVTYQENLVLLM